jgi:hypothetical protein
MATRTEIAYDTYQATTHYPAAHAFLSTLTPAVLRELCDLTYAEVADGCRKATLVARLANDRHPMSIPVAGESDCARTARVAGNAQGSVTGWSHR